MLSTIILMLGSAFLTSLITTSKSMILRVGFVGLSIHTILVSFLMAFRTLLTSVMSTNSACIPWLSPKNRRMYRFVPP